jgi:ribonuclease BN (tRNA processing enzyme)
MENGASLDSEALTIRVLPRSHEEMGRHIERLAAELRRASIGEARTQLIRRLMYTADRRAAQPLLELADQDNNAAFWIGEAFSTCLRMPTFWMMP